MHGVLCFVGRSWGWPMHPKIVGRATSRWPLKLALRVGAPGGFGPLVPEIMEHLRQNLKLGS